jgi:hypothetical protein
MKRKKSGYSMGATLSNYGGYYEKFFGTFPDICPDGSHAVRLPHGF